MTRSEAAAIRDASIRRIMAERGCIYPIARAHLEREKRTRRADVLQLMQLNRWTFAAAFYTIQNAINGGRVPAETK
jgi:hypothetical protein